MPLSSPRTSRDPAAPISEGLVKPAMAGIVTALVGFTSTFAVVLSGLRAVGADPQQASSGLLALCLVVGAGVVFLAWRSRLPVTLAWSTPGAALLAVAGIPDGGWPAAVGAFLVTGVLIAVTGLVRPLGRLISSIPTPLAQAMLAGVLLPLCLAPVKALQTAPLLVVPVLVCWLLLSKLAPRWAVPGALGLALAGIVVQLVVEGRAVPADGLLPAMQWTLPSWSLGAVAGIALPLYIVTMASQNVPGVAVLGSFGYQAPWRASMLVTGAGTLLAAPFGGHAINLAALSAALAAGEEAGADRGRRWVAGFVSGLAYLLLGAFSAGLAALVAAAPAGVLEAVAGLALLGTLAGSTASAFAEPDERTAAVVTFLVAASGLSFMGIGAAFWALLAGLLVRVVLKSRNKPEGKDAG
ncbi:MAG TPA: benzoate/H(+) symporter BenE family transporter [Arthrobacter sp.]|nr:benzoate/H(+) symporter BenE family transporter [Arthrobacter sp.]